MPLGMLCWRGNPLHAMAPIATLPYALLWAASLAASTDPTKGVIADIDVRRIGKGKIRIAATDGHRCFRAVFPQSEKFWMDEGTDELRLAPKAFSKAPTSKMLFAELDEGGVAAVQSRMGLTVETVAWKPTVPWDGTAYPNIDGIWPDSLACKPDAFIAFNAKYVGDFCKVASRLTGNSVCRLSSGESPVSPVVWSAVLDGDWVDGGTEEIWLEYLLMPVQVRV